MHTHTKHAGKYTHSYYPKYYSSLLTDGLIYTQIPSGKLSFFKSQYHNHQNVVSCTIHILHHPLPYTFTTRDAHTCIQTAMPFHYKGIPMHVHNYNYYYTLLVVALLHCILSTQSRGTRGRDARGSRHDRESMRELPRKCVEKVSKYPVANLYVTIYKYLWRIISSAKCNR